jgi:hypothetical protein
MPTFTTFASNRGIYGKNPLYNVTASSLILNLDASNSSSYLSSGTTWTDLSASPTNAVLTNGPTFTRPYIQFDGVDDSATIASNAKFAFGTGDFTLECWIYPQDFTKYTHMIAFPQQSIMALKADIGNPGGGNIYLYTPTFDTYGSTGGWSLTINTWNHVVFKRESSVAYAFLNGLSRGSKVGFTNNFTAQVCNIHNGHPGEFSQCRISAVRVYNRALSNQEIFANFGARRSLYGV